MSSFFISLSLHSTAPNEYLHTGTAHVLWAALACLLHSPAPLQEETLGGLHLLHHCPPEWFSPYSLHPFLVFPSDVPPCLAEFSSEELVDSKVAVGLVFRQLIHAYSRFQLQRAPSHHHPSPHMRHRTFPQAQDHPHCFRYVIDLPHGPCEFCRVSLIHLVFVHGACGVPGFALLGLTLRSSMNIRCVIASL